MTADPSIIQFIAATKIKADEVNSNFTNMTNYVKDSVDEMQEYVDGFMPSQTGNDGKYLQTDGDSASWADINPDKVALTAGSANTLEEGKWHTLTNGTSTTSISMFTVSDSDKTSIAFVDFTTSTTTQPTFGTCVFDYTPTWNTSKHNLVTIFSDDNGSNYAANHRVLGY